MKKIFVILLSTFLLFACESKEERELRKESERNFNVIVEKFEEQPGLYVHRVNDKELTIEETLDIGWELLRILPRTELKRIREEYLDKYYEKK